jgi:hypothetical protein
MKKTTMKKQEYCQCNALMKVIHWKERGGRRWKKIKKKKHTRV